MVSAEEQHVKILDLQEEIKKLNQQLLQKDSISQRHEQEICNKYAQQIAVLKDDHKKLELDLFKARQQITELQQKLQSGKLLDESVERNVLVSTHTQHINTELKGKFLKEDDLLV